MLLVTSVHLVICFYMSETFILNEEVMLMHTSIVTSLYAFI